MATLVLGAVGRVFGGPLGGIAGTVLGGLVDRSLFGGGGRVREAGRIADLGVQSSAYGEAIPIVFGRMRIAGNLIWTSGIREGTTRGGGGKRGGPATDNFSYSASFAVALAGRAIIEVGRVWADGRLIRGADGVFLSPVTMRLHHGGEDQDADPLIVAAEGTGGTPAYRGVAYVVIEDMPLGDYGNRIPSLSFEIVADAGPGLYAGGAMLALARAAADGRLVAGVEGAFPELDGYAADRPGSIADAMAPLLAVADAGVVAAGAGLAIVGEGGRVTAIPAGDGDAAGAAAARRGERREWLGGARPAAFEIGFHDISRDYQPGLQRVRQAGGTATEAVAVAAAMRPAAAKTLALTMLQRANAGALRATLRLPWRHVGVAPGDRIVVTGDPTVWRVRGTQFENFVVGLDLVRSPAPVRVAVAGDGGRAQVFNDVAAGPTTLVVLDLPPLPGEMAAGARLWVAAAGASPGWRRAPIELSMDGGASYSLAGAVEGGGVLGSAVDRLAAADPAGWDRSGSVEIELLNEAMWLESRSEASVLAGANLALLGDEIVQFATAEALGERRFRLSGLLRGRRGSDGAIGDHRAGERFVLLEGGGLLPIDLAADAIGGSVRLRPAGVGDIGTPATEIVVGGRNLLPLSPVGLTIGDAGGAAVARWTRRSRAGFGWPDFVDLPLAEASEAYLVSVELAGRLVREVVVTTPDYTYGLAERLADGGGAEVTIKVAQLSAVVGPGSRVAATRVFQA